MILFTASFVLVYKLRSKYSSSAGFLLILMQSFVFLILLIIFEVILHKEQKSWYQVKSFIMKPIPEYKVEIEKLNITNIHLYICNIFRNFISLLTAHSTQHTALKIKIIFFTKAYGVYGLFMPFLFFNN